jgi:transposase
MLGSMTTQAYNYETQRLDHLGIVAGICQRINLIELIDGSLPSPTERKVSCGQATQAMVLNALGLTGRALYLMPEYMENKPVDLLVGAGLRAADFNDDTLGRALDELQQAGVTELFARVAAEAVRVYDIDTRYAHLDSSSFAVQGRYDSAYAQEMTEKHGAVTISRGYSKDQRPDLKQVVVNLITSQASALPLWLEVLDGNSSDKRAFQTTVAAYCQELAEGESPPWFVMDSAGYSQENLQAWGQIPWITRVPETLKAAQVLLTAVATDEMVAVGHGYRAWAVGAWYGDVKQRWLLVYSPQAYERERQQLDKQIARQEPDMQTEWRRLCRQRFQCAADACAALTQFGAQLRWWKLAAAVEPVEKHKRPGRPTEGALPDVVGWHIQGVLALDEAAVAAETAWLGRFVLATNLLDEALLPDDQLLSCYKEQSSSIERGFRFLKDPMFFADSLFLKSPVRIMAMIMVMGLSLLVYALAEHELRAALVAQNETIPHQTGKPTQQVTMRRVAQLFEGVDVLNIRAGPETISRQVLNLSPVRLKILRLFNATVQNCYLLEI